jgi:hypothetical protein
MANYRLTAACRFSCLFSFDLHSTCVDGRFLANLALPILTDLLFPSVVARGPYLDAGWGPEWTRRRATWTRSTVLRLRQVALSSVAQPSESTTIRRREE